MSNIKSGKLISTLTFLSVLTIVIITTSFALLGAYLIPTLPVEIVGFYVTRIGVGGICSEEILLYDSSGRGYGRLDGTVHYEGPAPLYSVDAKLLGESFKDDMGCLTSPRNIKPELAVKGDPVYPLQVLITGPPNDRLRKGESHQISLDLKISDFFYEDAPYLILPDQNPVQVGIRIDAPGFIVSPHSDKVREVILSTNNTETLRWIIAPLEQSMGNQQILISVLTKTDELQYDLTIDVRTVYGLKKIHGALIGGIVGGISSSALVLVSITKIIDWVENRKQSKLNVKEEKEILSSIDSME